ncbi:hypothetical protein [Sphingobacterium cellulitidis]|uniref:hypothetical protein n=1 Tax=Sphingobacterium cellulitidis TaxID=1768011 RepID=UPI000B94359B|nr:hypothetical protein CHT99_09170 [Sphingobacterium cellulitidis]
MPNKPIIFCLFLFFTLSYSFAQVSKRYTGTIYSIDSTLLIKNVDVINLRTQQMIRSDFDGSFGIDANPMDSIAFVHPHWNRKSVLAHELTKDIFLQKKALVIEEIVIMGNTKAAKIRELEQMKKDYNVKGGLYYSGEPPWYLLLPFGMPTVTYFYEKFSKAGRNARKFDAFMKQEIKNMEVDQIFNKSTITDVIPMDTEELEKFMVEYRPDFEVAQYWTTYDLHVYVKKHYKEFKEKSPSK